MERLKEVNHSRAGWRYFGWFILVCGISGAIETPKDSNPDVERDFKIMCGIVALIGVWLISRGPKEKN